MTDPSRNGDSPVIGLCARPGEGALVRPLVRALSHRAVLRAVRPGGPAPDAVLATSLAAWAAHDLARIPTAVFVAEAAHWNAATASSEAIPIVVTPSAWVAGEARQAGHPVLEVAPTWSDDRQASPNWPLARARLRARRDLPERLVLVVRDAPAQEGAEPRVYEKLDLPGGDVWVWTVTPDEPDLDALAAAASVVVADGDDDRTAPRLARLAVGVLIELGTDEHRRVEAATQAVELALDDTRTSRLVAAAVLSGRRGSADHAARTLLRLLGLDRGPSTMQTRLEAHLGNLRVPPSSPFQVRLDAAFAPFTIPAPPPDPITAATSRTSS